LNNKEIRRPLLNHSKQINKKNRNIKIKDREGKRVNQHQILLGSVCFSFSK
jgi:hypothetical protein